MIPEVRKFIIEQIDNRDTMLTRFQVEQLLIRYGNLVADECAEKAKTYYSGPKDKVWPDREVYNPLQVKRQIK